MQTNRGKKTFQITYTTKIAGLLAPSLECPLERPLPLLNVFFNSWSHLQWRFLSAIENSSVSFLPKVPACVRIYSHHSTTIVLDQVDSEHYCYKRNIYTSIVFPLEAVTMSPGLMPEPLIIFSDAADMKWTCQLQGIEIIRKYTKMWMLNTRTS